MEGSRIVHEKPEACKMRGNGVFLSYRIRERRRNLLLEPYTHKIQYYETDKMQVTHHSNYVRFMEEARIDFLSRIGWDYEKLEEIGIISPVVELHCEYRKPTTFPQVIQIQVSVKDVSAVKLQLEYRMTVEDELVFTAGSTHCFLDEQGRPIRLKTRFPEFYEALLALK